MKKIIKRQCHSCRVIKDRNDLIKITLSGGKIFVNPDSKTTGRSVYVCKYENCIKKLIKSKGIKKGLKFNGDILIQEIESLLKSFV